MRPASTRAAVPDDNKIRRKLRTMEATRVLIADDDVLVRAGVASVLAEAGYDVVGQVGD